MLSIVVSWCDRKELARALPSMVQAAMLCSGDVTLVNFGGDPDLLRRQVAQFAGQVRVVEVHGKRFFNKSCAQNIGAAHTGCPVLFFCDCDIVLDPPSVERMARRVLETPQTFATLAGVRESEVNSRGGHHVVSFGYELRIRTADGRMLAIVDNEEDSETGTRQAPGLLFVAREDFVAINGYNAKLQGWGWEDQDMISRLTLGRSLTRITEDHALHLSHDDNARLSHYPPVGDRWESRDRMFRRALANYDKNDFGGTFSEDVASLSASSTRQECFAASPREHALLPHSKHRPMEGTNE